MAHAWGPASSVRGNAVMDYRTQRGTAVTETDRMLITGEAWWTFWELADWHEALDTLASVN